MVVGLACLPSPGRWDLMSTFAGGGGQARPDGGHIARGEKAVWRGEMASISRGQKGGSCQDALGKVTREVGRALGVGLCSPNTVTVF